MAIIDLQTKNYMKLDLNETFIKGGKVYVAYQIYKNEEERKLEKTRLLEVQTFLNRLGKIIYEYQKELELLFGEKQDESLILKYKSKITNLEELRENFDNIQYFIYKRDEKFGLGKLKQLKLLKELGFKEEWISSPLNPSGMVASFSSNFTNQKFTADSMYKELKKVFKNSKIMDV